MAWNPFNLFKYNPATDGEQTFNIDQALNQNWDKVTARDTELRTAIDGKALSEDLSSEAAAREDADAALGVLIGNKADKSTMVNKTLLAASWTGAAAPYSYSLAVAGVTATSNQEILPTTDITEAQLVALQAANILDGGQAANTITLKAWGDKPAIDVPIRVILRGDM